MKRKILSIICLMAIMVSCFAAGVYATSNLEEIKAYLNYGISIKYNGQNQTMFDANGKQVYPISYEGTTYVPIRAVSNILGVDVEWDGPNNTVLLGETGKAKDFIEEFNPYSKDGWCSIRRIKDSDKANFAGKDYSTFIFFDPNWGGAELYYNLEGKYTTLKFDGFYDNAYYGEEQEILIYGDNDELLEKIIIKTNELPETFIVDVSDVQRLKIDGDGGYIFNATIE